MMDNIWAPWRIGYILNAEKEKGCLFCKKSKSKNDRGNLVLARGRYSFVLLNIYPYTNGHVMIVPYRHTGNIERLIDAELKELMLYAKRTVKVLRICMKPDGFNIGFNLGKVAGAGIKEHIHMHIVPRWEADTNFMPVISGTRVIPESLEAVWSRFRKEWKKVSRETSAARRKIE